MRKGTRESDRSTLRLKGGKWGDDLAEERDGAEGSHREQSRGCRD